MRAHTDFIDSAKFLDVYIITVFRYNAHIGSNELEMQQFFEIIIIYDDVIWEESMLSDILKEKGKTVYKAAKESNVSYTTLHDIVIEKTDIKKASAETLYRLARYLDMSMEALYVANDDCMETIFIHNKGRYIVVETSVNRHQYLGPKNLICLNQINKIEGNVICVEAVFKDEDCGFVIEEDYIDLQDVLDVDKCILNHEYEVRIGQRKKKTKADLIDESLMVSDNMAIMWLFYPGVSHPMIEVRSLAKPAMKTVIRMSDYAIIETNMSKAMQNRAMEAVARNRELIILECGEGHAYA